MAPSERRPVPVRVDAERRTDVRRLLIVATFFLALAIIKPWPAPVRLPPPAATPAALAEASPSTFLPTPTPPSAVSLLCFEPLGWRVASIEMTVGFRLRTWGLVNPIQATDARDPAIPRIVVTSSSVIALGYCAPVDQPPPDDVDVVIYRLDAVRPPSPVRIVRLGPNPASPLGGLYLPAPVPAPSSQTPATASWDNGIYVFRVHASRGYERWFGADVRLF